MKSLICFWVYFLLIVVIVFCGCTSSDNRNKQVNVINKVDDKNDSSDVKEYTVNATLYHQQSGEYRALSFQAFQLARIRINMSLATKKHLKPYAIISDLDETVLNNSEYVAQLIKDNSLDLDDKDWNEWVNKGIADSMPGSVSFLQYVTSKKIKIFYITNRKSTQLQNTFLNMQKLGFPQIDSNNFLMRTDSRNKQKRFDSVMRNYTVILQLGDNLNDFSGVFYMTSPEQRKHLVDSLNNLFGSFYITLPNPTYGDWEDALYGYYNVDSTNSQMISRRHKLLIGYK